MTVPRHRFPIRAGVRASKLITVRVTPEEDRWIHEVAAREQVTISEMVRALALLGRQPGAIARMVAGEVDEALTGEPWAVRREVTDQDELESRGQLRITGA